jgi:hypothetical protein
VEVDWEEDSIAWITNSRKFTTTFVEFATACQINYEITQNGEYVWVSNVISIDTRRS